MDILNKIIKLINEKGITEKQFLLDLGLNTTLMSDWKSGRLNS